MKKPWVLATAPKVAREDADQTVVHADCSLH